MNSDGTSPVNVSRNKRGDDLDPVWSTDGSKIAFTSNRDGNYEVHVMDAGGSGQANVTRNGSADSQPTWGTAP